MKSSLLSILGTVSFRHRLFIDDYRHRLVHRTYSLDIALNAVRVAVPECDCLVALVAHGLVLHLVEVLASLALRFSPHGLDAWVLALARLLGGTVDRHVGEAVLLEVLLGQVVDTEAVAHDHSHVPLHEVVEALLHFVVELLDA